MVAELRSEVNLLLALENDSAMDTTKKEPGWAAKVLLWLCAVVIASPVLIVLLIITALLGHARIGLTGGMLIHKIYLSLQSKVYG